MPSPSNPHTHTHTNPHPPPTHMSTFPNTFSSFDEAFHDLESATIGKDASPALFRALHALGNARDIYNEDASWFSEPMHPADVADLIADLMHHRAKVEGWTVSDVNNAEYLGTLETDNGGAFEVLATPSRLIFGGACNAGFLESGYMLRDPSMTLDEDILELSEDLDAFYQSRGHNRIVCNDRM